MRRSKGWFGWLGKSVKHGGALDIYWVGEAGYMMLRLADMIMLYDYIISYIMTLHTAV
jgi:hypothetical protein